MTTKTVLLSGVSLLAMTSHALADPATIGSVIISAFLSVGAGGLLPVASATAIGLTAIGGAVTLANLAFTAASFFNRPSANPQTVRNTTAGQEGPGRYATGRFLLGGEIAFGNTAQYDLYRLLLHCFGEVDAIEEYRYDGRLIVVESDGKVSSPPWAIASGSNLYVHSQLGTGSETAYTKLTTDFPAIWTSAHRARGIAQSLLHVINPGTGNGRFPKLLQGGIKDLDVLARVGKFYDPRTTSTAWTLNGVLQCLHWFRRLPGVTDDIIDFDGTEAAATAAEVNVPILGGGTAPRCTISGGWKGPLTTEIVADMMRSAGIEPRVNADGEYRLAFLEDDPTSEITFLARHILSVDYQSGEESARRPNILRLKYLAPHRNFTMSEIDLSGASWAKVQDEIDAYGEQEMLVELVFCTDPSQAQRIARRLFWMDRAEKGVLITNKAGRAAIGKKVITFEVPDVGTDHAPIEVKARKGTARVNFAKGYCEIPFVVIPPELATPWNAATMEQPAPPALTDLQYESTLSTPAAPSAAIVVQYPDNSYETRVKFAGVAGGVTSQLIYRTYSGGNPGAWQSIGTKFQGESGAYYGRAAVNPSGSEFDTKVQWFDANGEASYFSDVLNRDPISIDNTTPAAPDDTGTAGGLLDLRAAELNVVRILVETNTDGAGWVTHDDFDAALPDTVYESTVAAGPGELVDWRASSFTSNGTQGPYVTGQIGDP